MDTHDTAHIADTADITDISIIRVKGCQYALGSVKKGIERLINGPLDFYKGGGIHPAELVSCADEYYLFHYWSSALTITNIGYMRVKKVYDTKNAILNVNLEEFEIFREYRQKGFGRLCADYVIEHLFSHSDNFQLFIHNLNVSSFVFWWSCTPRIFLEMFSAGLGYMFGERPTMTDAEHLLLIPEFFDAHPQDETEVEKFMKIIAKKFVETDKEEDILAFVNNHHIWKSMKESVRKF